VEPSQSGRLLARHALSCAQGFSHPRNILIRKSELVPALDEWIARQFDPCRIDATIDALTTAGQADLGA
jgi:hypothetical protein